MEIFVDYNLRRPWDDDNDGRINEDPIDGMNNDGDNYASPVTCPKRSADEDPTWLNPEDLDLDLYVVWTDDTIDSLGTVEVGYGGELNFPDLSVEQLRHLRVLDVKHFPTPPEYTMLHGRLSGNSYIEGEGLPNGRYWLIVYVKNKNPCVPPVDFNVRVYTNMSTRKELEPKLTDKNGEVIFHAVRPWSKDKDYDGYLDEDHHDTRDNDGDRNLKSKYWPPVDDEDDFEEQGGKVQVIVTYNPQRLMSGSDPYDPANGLDDDRDGYVDEGQEILHLRRNMGDPWLVNDNPRFDMAIDLDWGGGDGYKYSGNHYDPDDDADGLINEDPADGVDNDGDGLIDEDPIRTCVWYADPDTDGDGIVDQEDVRNAAMAYLAWYYNIDNDWDNYERLVDGEDNDSDIYEDHLDFEMGGADEGIDEDPGIKWEDDDNDGLIDETMEKEMSETGKVTGPEDEDRDYWVDEDPSRFCILRSGMQGGQRWKVTRFVPYSEFPGEIRPVPIDVHVSPGVLITGTGVDPHKPVDNDLDGKINEDPIDGRDNDGDWDIRRDDLNGNGIPDPGEPRVDEDPWESDVTVTVLNTVTKEPLEKAIAVLNVNALEPKRQVNPDGEEWAPLGMRYPDVFKDVELYLHNIGRPSTVTSFPEWWDFTWNARGAHGVMQWAPWMFYVPPGTEELRFRIWWHQVETSYYWNGRPVSREDVDAFLMPPGSSIFVMPGWFLTNTPYNVGIMDFYDDSWEEPFDYIVIEDPKPGAWMVSFSSRTPDGSYWYDKRTFYVAVEARGENLYWTWTDQFGQAHFPITVEEPSEVGIFVDKQGYYREIMCDQGNARYFPYWNSEEIESIGLFETVIAWPEQLQADKETYVVINVGDAGMGVPVQGAIVQLHGYDSKVTDENGEAIFRFVPEKMIMAYTDYDWASGYRTWREDLYEKRLKLEGEAWAKTEAAKVEPVGSLDKVLPKKKVYKDVGILRFTVKPPVYTPDIVKRSTQFAENTEYEGRVSYFEENFNVKYQYPEEYRIGQSFTIIFRDPAGGMPVIIPESQRPYELPGIPPGRSLSGAYVVYTSYPTGWKEKYGHGYATEIWEGANVSKVMSPYLFPEGPAYLVLVDSKEAGIYEELWYYPVEQEEEMEIYEQGGSSKVRKEFHLKGPYYEGDTIVIGGTEYVIENIAKDGSCLTLLRKGEGTITITSVVYKDWRAVMELSPYYDPDRERYQVSITYTRTMSFDNDQDKKLDEDPIDGVDNDGDGKVDEDPKEEDVYHIPVPDLDGAKATKLEARVYWSEGTSRERIQRLINLLHMNLGLADFSKGRLQIEGYNPKGKRVMFGSPIGLLEEATKFSHRGMLFTYGNQIGVTEAKGTTMELTKEGYLKGMVTEKMLPNSQESRPLLTPEDLENSYWQRYEIAGTPPYVTLQKGFHIMHFTRYADKKNPDPGLWTIKVSYDITQEQLDAMLADPPVEYKYTLMVTLTIEPEEELLDIVIPKWYIAETVTDRFVASKEINDWLLDKYYLAKSPERVFVTRSDKAVDIAAIAVHATATKTPIVIVDPKEIPSATKDVLKRIEPKEVVIIGREVAVSEKVERELEEMGYKVSRIGGPTRFETAAEVAKTYWPEGSEIAVLAPVPIYEDEEHKTVPALIAMPLAKYYQAPLLYLDRVGGEDVIPEATKEALSSLGVKKVIIVGETKVAEDLMQMGYDVEQIAGKDVFETAVLVAKQLKDVLHYRALAIINAEDPGALNAAMVAALKEGVVLPVKTDEVPAEIAKFLSDYKFKVRWVFFSGTMSQSVREQVIDLVKPPVAKVSRH